MRGFGKLFNENFYVGAVWTAGNRGTPELNNTITLPYRGYSYDDETIAFQKGFEAFEKNARQKKQCDLDRDYKKGRSLPYPPYFNGVIFELTVS